MLAYLIKAIATSSGLGVFKAAKLAWFQEIHTLEYRSLKV